MTLLEAIQKGDAKSASELVHSKPALARERTAEGISYISLAMYHRQPEIARQLAATRDDLDLFEACAVGDLERVRTLIGQDVNVNAFSPDGFAPIALAAFFRHPQIVAELIGSGADVNAQAKNPLKVAAIHAAVSARNAVCVELLLRAGADPNLEQQQRLTPMQAARANQDDTIIRLLKEYGAQ